MLSLSMLIVHGISYGSGCNVLDGLVEKHKTTQSVVSRNENLTYLINEICKNLRIDITSQVASIVYDSLSLDDKVKIFAIEDYIVQNSINIPILHGAPIVKSEFNLDERYKEYTSNYSFKYFVNNHLIHFIKPSFESFICNYRAEWKRDTIVEKRILNIKAISKTNSGYTYLISDGCLSRNKLNYVYHINVYNEIWILTRTKHVETDLDE